MRSAFKMLDPTLPLRVPAQPRAVRWPGPPRGPTANGRAPEWIERVLVEVVVDGGREAALIGDEQHEELPHDGVARVHESP